MDCRRAYRSRRGRTIPAAHLSRSLPLLAFLCALLVLVARPPGRGPAAAVAPWALAAEMVATSEWQRLGPDDTIPKGLHVRIDMETGEKWAKLVDDGEEDVGLAAPYNGDGGGEEAVEVVVGADGSATAVSSSSSASVSVSTASSSSAVAPVDDEETAPPPGPRNEDGSRLDYGMMHRTLSKLGDDEMARYGGLPAPPAAHVTPEERLGFERQMKEIWERRQQEIASMQEEFMADLPKMLLQRIRYVEGYLSDPKGYRDDLIRERWEAAEGASGGEIHNEDVVSNIVEVLEDIEYHVADIDHARDFHTLGGWSVLVSMLSDAVHGGGGTNATEPSAVAEGEEEQAHRAVVDEIQAAAAWAIGTAAKNSEEFHGWALEDLAGAFEASSDQPLTAVSMILSALGERRSGGGGAAQAKRQRCLYALGSLLRGNRASTRHFVDIGGPAILGAGLAEGLRLDAAPGGSSDLTAADYKHASKVLGLGNDLIADVLNNEGTGDGDSGYRDRLIGSVTTEPWCRAASLLVRPFPSSSMQVRERALEAMLTLAPYCRYGKDDRRAVELVAAEVHSSDGGSLSGLDAEFKAQFLSIINSILEKTGDAGS